VNNKIMLRQELIAIIIGKDREATSFLVEAIKNFRK
jgi:hypothetical protein